MNYIDTNLVISLILTELDQTRPPLSDSQKNKLVADIFKTNDEMDFYITEAVFTEIFNKTVQYVRNQAKCQKRGWSKYSNFFNDVRALRAQGLKIIEKLGCGMKIGGKTITLILDKKCKFVSTTISDLPWFYLKGGASFDDEPRLFEVAVMASRDPIDFSTKTNNDRHLINSLAYTDVALLLSPCGNRVFTRDKDLVRWNSILENTAARATLIYPRY